MSATWQQQEFDRAFARYIPTTDKDLSTIMNERGLSVLGHTWDRLQPKAPQAVRKRVGAYLHTRLSTRIRITKAAVRHSFGLSRRSPKRRFAQRGDAWQQFQRVHLIVQSLYAGARGKLTRRAVKYAETAGGGPGLYGSRMATVAGAFAGRAQRGVGFLKSHLIPLIKAMNAVSQNFRRSMPGISNIARWPGSAASSIAIVATPGQPEVIFNITNPSYKIDSRGADIMYRAMSDAFVIEARDLDKHVTRKMQREADRINAR